WKIIGQEGIPISTIYIFDRYGKLLSQLDPDGAGWDGTYNGHAMPAGDYWFTIQYLEGEITPTEKEFKAHFSIKR
ncbi:MAG: T9SS type B sorting domain-containing protein, partial [Flavobacteriaceae bacterium]